MPNTKHYIVTAETEEAIARRDGTSKVYGPDETHTEADVWRGPGPEPDGIWLTPDGNWRRVLYEDSQIDIIGRNLCSCPFCKKLRAA